LAKGAPMNRKQRRAAAKLGSQLPVTAVRPHRRRVIYFLQPFPKPSGGVGAIYRHVEILTKNGIEAYVALREKPKVDFYGTTAPLLIGNVNIQPNDVCVTPEEFSEDGRDEP
jgi:hypothetical protein